MESNLKDLVEANLPQNRNRWALDWLERKGKIIGIIGSNVPEEPIMAAGLLPWKITGTWEAQTPHASAYRPGMTCVFCTHVLESVLNGELSFLGGVVTTQHDDDFKHLWYVIHHLHKFPFDHIMYLPHTNNIITLGMWTKSVVELKEKLEYEANLVISDQKLSSAIETCNTTRRLLRALYELRKKPVPAVSGTEAMGIVIASRIMPKELFNQNLSGLLPYLEKRKISMQKKTPRILVSGDYLDHPGYLQLIEGAGCTVAMDDLDTGSRYFWNDVDTSNGDSWKALAKRYLEVPSPRMANWEEQVDQILNWVKEFNIDGIIELRQLYSFPREFMFTYSSKRIKEAGIPHLFLRKEYHYAGEGMLKTRIEAFLEMIRGKG